MIKVHGSYIIEGFQKIC